MNEKFIDAIEALEAAEERMSDLHNTMEGLEMRMEADWHEVQTIYDYRKRLAGMNKFVKTMLAKREKALLEKMKMDELHIEQRDGRKVMQSVLSAVLNAPWLLNHELGGLAQEKR